jgi:hypothetical protein
MKSDELGLPTIIVPYPGPAEEEGVQDIFVNLRPETNGVIAESAILKVVKAANKTQDAMKLIYLANYPGEFIVAHKIIEQYYSLRFHFAVHGKAAFTPSMKRRFSDWFQLDYEQAPLVGSFEAIEILGVQPEELFEIWVAEKDVVFINGQLIKKIGKLYVINYDIPALLHKNSKNTDIAVMIFRTKLAYPEVKSLVYDMNQALCGIGVLNPQFDAARAFHYSKSPFEQILDSISFLFTASNEKLGLADFTFSRWLLSMGYTEEAIIDLLRNPLVSYRKKDARPAEDNLFLLSQLKSYKETLSIMQSIEHQHRLISHGPLFDKILNALSKKDNL